MKWVAILALSAIRVAAHSCPCGDLCHSLVNAPRPDREVFLVAQAVKPGPRGGDWPEGRTKPPIDWEQWDGLKHATTIVYAWGHPIRWFANGTAYAYNEYGATDPFPDYGLLCAAHARGVRVVPSIAGGSKYGNASAMLPNATRRQRLADNLAAITKLYGFDGVEIDFEGSYKTQDTTVWTNYLDFLSRLSGAMHAAIPGSYVEMTHSCGPTNFMGAHAKDVVEATDAVLMMCYDFNRDELTQAGPDSPIRNGWWGHGMIDPKYGVAHLIAQGLPASWIIASVNWAAKRPSRFCKTLFSQIERAPLHSYGPEIHSCRFLDRLPLQRKRLHADQLQLRRRCPPDERVPVPDRRNPARARGRVRHRVGAVQRDGLHHVPAERDVGRDRAHADVVPRREGVGVALRAGLVA